MQGFMERSVSSDFLLLKALTQDYVFPICLLWRFVSDQRYYFKFECDFTTGWDRVTVNLAAPSSPQDGLRLLPDSQIAALLPHEQKR